MKIVHIIPSLACGGAEILMGNIAIEQALTGHEVNIIVLEKLNDSFLKYLLKNQLKNIDISFVNYYINKLWNLN